MTMADARRMEAAYLDAVKGVNNPPLMCWVADDQTYGCGGYSETLPGWWHEIRRSADDAILLRVVNGITVYDAAEACP